MPIIRRADFMKKAYQVSTALKTVARTDNNIKEGY